MTTVTTTTSVPPIQPTGSVTAQVNPGAAPKEVVATTTKVDVDRISTPDSAVTTITITTTAQQAAAGNPVFSSKKVEEIKLAMAEGRFEIKTENIADALIRGVSELVHPRKS